MTVNRRLEFSIIENIRTQLLVMEYRPTSQQQLPGSTPYQEAPAVEVRGAHLPKIAEGGQPVRRGTKERARLYDRLVVGVGECQQTGRAGYLVCASREFTLV